MNCLHNIALLSCFVFYFMSISDTNAQRYAQRYRVNVQRQEKHDTIPPGAASLAFVFDITGSMYDDLVQVIEGAAKILLTTLARREKPLYNYVLVPFHDPEIGPVTVTTDPDKFQNDLRELYVQGGGDCPEMSIGAIKMALEESLPNSFIYVFTDARAKDYDLTEQVLTLIQQKQSQVVFVMTGDCGNTSHPGYKAYEQIASTSSGQVFLLKKSQVNQVLNFVRVAVQSQKVNLMSVDRDSGSSRVYVLPVDAKLQDFTISLSGLNPVIDLRDPTGKRINRYSGLNELLKIRKALIVNMKNPTPGLWKLKVKSRGPHTLRVTGLSSLDFHHGFSQIPTIDLNSTKPRPIKGVPTHVLLNATNLDYPGRFSKLELISLHGKTLMEIPLSYKSEHPALYNVSAFIPPDDFFYIKVRGLDYQGYEFQRTTDTAISPAEPTKPVVKMQKVTNGYYDKNVDLECSVESLVPFVVDWFRGLEKLGMPLFYRKSINATVTIDAVTSASEGYYTCNATNAAGWAAAETYLDVKDPPPEIINPRNISVIPGETAILTCVAFSTVEFNITWHRENRVDDLTAEPRVKLFTNGSIEIKNVIKKDEGNYICRVSNEGGFTDEAIFLKVQEAPLVSARPLEQNFVTGEVVNISCTAQAFPAPTYVWFRKGEVLPITERVDYRNGYLTIRNATRDDAGTYECEATNSAGVGSIQASLKYIEAPTITVPKSTVLVANGDSASLQCYASGIPTPKIKWYKGEIEMQSVSFIQISDSGEELKVLGTQEMDSGKYSCVAKNEAGTHHAHVVLEVGTPPTVVESPTSQGVDIENNVTLPCQATGKPEPDILWRSPMGKLLSPGGRFYQFQTGALFIENIQKHDEGMYTCIVQNQFGIQEASAFITVTGIVRPLIAFTNPHIEVISGRKVRLTCLVLLGKPRPKIMWMKMGELVRESRHVKLDENGNLDISNVAIKHEGEYTCVASNVGGNATYVTRLDVQVPPSIKEGERDFTAIQGHSIRLPCEVKGDPKPSITWTKNGNRISHSDPHYFVNADGSLDIFSADPQDTATYSCTALNIAGVKEARMTLFVQIPPEIAYGPDEFIAIRNSPVQLPCEANGIPPPSITWQKDGEELSREHQNLFFLPNGALRINSVREQDSGIYECVATSIAGNATKMMNVIVQVPPKILSQGPNTVTVMKGDPAMLECETYGDPLPTILWRKDLQTIDLYDPDIRYLIQDTGSLLIPSAEIQDSARYVCLVENPAGVVSREISLIVHDPPSISEDAPRNGSVIENQRVVLQCPAKGTPRPIITWYKNDVPLLGNEIGVRVTLDGSLELDQVQEVDAGKYKCVAANVAGNLTHVVDLKVYVPPRFVEEDGSAEDPHSSEPTQAVVRNKPIKMSCIVSAIPPPQITWYKDGREIQYSDQDGRIEILDDGRELLIHNADVRDTARYTCIASNLAGETEKNFDLTVQVPPTIEQNSENKKNFSVVATRPIVINCPAKGIPVPEIYWFKDGELVLDTDPNIRILAEGRRLEITSSRVEDTGHYKCVAKNPAGTTDQEYDLNVFIPPRIPNNDRVSNPEVIIEHTSTLICPATGVPPPIITWYRDQKKITKNSTRLFILNERKLLQIRSTHTSDAARYSCRAANIAGEAEKYFDLNVLVPPSIDETGLNKDPKVIVNRTMVINCPAQGIPTPSIKWLRNDEELDVQAHSNIQVVADGRQIRITKAKITDTAVYTCRIENKAGRFEVNFNLAIQVPTSIDAKNIDKTPNVLVNRSITLNCPASGIPPPKITWFKDDRPIIFEEFQNLKSIWDGTQLTITDAVVSDTGRYSCRASNPAGSAELNYDLNVWVPPYIDPNESTEENPNVIVNQTIVIMCDAHGVPEPAIRWLRNGRPIEVGQVSRFRIQSRGKQMEIRSSQVADSATYTCIATNDAGLAERSFNVKVLVPPVIDASHLQKKIKVIKGRPVILHCPASGHPAPAIEWFKERQPIQLDERVHLLAGSKQLEITNTREGDTARYTCVASNVAGQAKVDYDLHILVPPSIDESNLVDNPRVIVNRTVLLECPASGIPKPQILWLKNGEPIESNEITVIMSEGRQLEIDSAQVSDTARYTCIAKNEAGELRRNFDLEVLLPPHIDRTDYIGELKVIENRTVYIDCPASGIPPPTIIWMKDAEPLLDFPYPNMRELNNGKQLEIRSAKSFDEAAYTCLASNVAGQRKLMYTLKVLRPPRIEGSRTPKDIIVSVGQPVRMECLPVGSPKPVITWYRDGVPMLPENKDDHINIIRNGHVLQIFNTQVKDTSTFSCLAENSAGQVEKRFNLQVHVPPKIKDSEGMEELSVIIGKSIIIECPVTGIPTPNIRWKREGEPLSLITNPNLRVLNAGRRLQVTNAQLMDIGGYKCVARNAAGNDSKEFLLNILVPPTIEEGRTLVASTVNTRTLLQCESLGLPEPKVTWQKDGKDIPNNSNNYRMHKPGSLEFSMVKVEDSGAYKCTAVNEAGSISREIKLIVQVPPSIAHKTPVTKKVTVGQRVTLPCEASGVPKPRIIWQKGTRVVSDSIGYRILDTGSLTISQAQLRDSGIYICIAQNNAGTALGQVRLVVQVPPSIEVKKSEYKVVQDREVILPCRASGMPPPKITWEKDGQEIPPTSFRYRVLRSGWLVIPLARSEDSGTYTCIASNSAGQQSVIFDLVVQVPPSIKQTARLRTVNIGDSAILECESEGFPPPDISWIKDGRQMLKNGGRYSVSPTGTLEVINVKAEDTGRYVCTAVNKAGRDSKEMLLRVHIPPTITTLPRDQEVPVNGRIELECVADGVPLPTITWLVNGSIKVYSAPSVNGRSRLIIDNASKRNDGTYMCVAVNPAGERRALAAVRVKVPPRVLIPQGTRAVTLAQRVIIPCNVIGGDPPSLIQWTKNGLPVEFSNRVQMLKNGSLIIHDSNNQDAGEYKCMAINDAGSSEGTALLEIKSAPNFLVEPHSQVVDMGTMVMMDCVAKGDPPPRVTWRWDSGIERKQLHTEGRVTIMPNNSLMIFPAEKQDSGVYICMARNPLGSVLVPANLTVQVHGGWSEWMPWSPCSTTCGQGMKERTRVCNNPFPANGGRPCRGSGRESVPCTPQNCPVTGNWGEWAPWSECTKSCNHGTHTRFRKCDSPIPQFGGAPCEGSDTLTEPCNMHECAVNGGWGKWSVWTPCSTSCGQGHQKRYRRCDNPRPSNGGDQCQGHETENQDCNLQECAGHGNWGSWTAWSVCSLSCGGGTRRRQRKCDSPAPTNGGRYCPGRDIQVDYCNTEACSIHGNWGAWSQWGDCTASCNGGQRRRFRICDNPAPKHNGRPCMGSSMETEACNRQKCSVDGEWGSWSKWTKCTQTCGQGSQQRVRKCKQPLFGGKKCHGDSKHTRKCGTQPCPVNEPRSAVANVIGNINNRDFGISSLVVNITKAKQGAKLRGILSNVPSGIGEHLQHLVSILAPVYWSTALELDKAANGYTLTHGSFRREVQVEFATGEILKMTHIARGKDDKGVLQLDIIVNGVVPPLPPRAHIKVEPYKEQYIQTGPGSIYAHSNRIFRINGYRLPYSWNHSISYDPSLGSMPYLVQQLRADDLNVQFDVNKEILQYQLSSSITKGEPSNRCPRGFILDPDGPYCRDRDECSEGSMCSHYCQNSPGSFTCSCPVGMTLKRDGRTCQDVNECERGMAKCGKYKECVNFEGSYKCISRCDRGFKRGPSGKCEDINECTESPGVCQQQCVNLIGSYRCGCERGYRRTSISECTDINECAERRHTCRPGSECQNTRGGYRCVQTCHVGMQRAENGSCVDIDECAIGRHRCFYNQLCINKKGGYMCACPRGYYSDGPGKPCLDVNECLKSPCQYRCRNIPGSYECICPPGQKRLTDRKSCVGLEFLPPANPWDQSDSMCQITGNCGYNPDFRSCPPGYTFKQGYCKDIDECKRTGRCEHMCINTPGSYQCSCPHGYRLAPNRRGCIDIDECKESQINCGPNKMCFNTRGSYECIDTPCPPLYDRDPRTGFCVLECSKSKIPCPPNTRYADILEFRLIALPSGIPAYQDLIRLIAYDQYGRHLPKTTFTIVENDRKIPFNIRLDDGKGVVFTLAPLQEQNSYTIKVRAKSFAKTRNSIQYQTTFLIHISVSRYPY